MPATPLISHESLSPGTFPGSRSSGCISCNHRPVGFLCRFGNPQLSPLSCLHQSMGSRTVPPHPPYGSDRRASEAQSLIPSRFQVPSSHRDNLSGPSPVSDGSDGRTHCPMRPGLATSISHSSEPDRRSQVRYPPSQQFHP